MQFLIQWSEVVPLMQEEETRRFTYPGVYLHFIDIGGHKRVVYVGTSDNISDRQNGRGGHIESYGAGIYTMFDLARIHEDIYNIIDNRRFDFHVGRGNIILGDEGKSNDERRMKLGEINRDSIYISAGMVGSVKSAGDLQRVESILRKWLLLRFKIGHYPGDFKKNILGSDTRLDNSNSLVKNMFPEKDSLWFRDLPEWVEDQEFTAQDL